MATALEWYAMKLDGWSGHYAIREKRNLEKDLFPYFGTRRIGEIESIELLAVICLVEERGALDEAPRVLVQKRPFRTLFPGCAAARHRGSDGGFNLLPGTPILGKRVQEQRAASHRYTRGGLNTKIHAVCDALGNPLRFVLTAGQRHDSKPVPELLGGLQAKDLLANKAYDSDKIVQAAQSQGMEIIIACRVNRKKNPRVLDTHRYKARHLVENLFQRMKVFRRVATRYDKLDVTFLVVRSINTITN